MTKTQRRVMTRHILLFVALAVASLDTDPAWLRWGWLALAAILAIGLPLGLKRLALEREQ